MEMETDGEIRKQFEEVAKWLTTAEARIVAIRALDRRRFGDRFVDDVLSEALMRLFGTFERRAEPYPGFNAAGLAVRTIDRVAADLLRKPTFRMQGLGIENDASDDAPEEPSPVHLPDALELSCRLSLHAWAAEHTWRASGALVVLTIAFDGADGFAPHVPVVGQGAARTQQQWWTGLHYAGRRDCFDGDNNTVRQRRARAMAQLRATLADALGEAGDDGR